MALRDLLPAGTPAPGNPVAVTAAVVGSFGSVSGRAPAGATVTVSKGGTSVGTATADSGGAWTLATTVAIADSFTASAPVASTALVVPTPPPVLSGTLAAATVGTAYSSGLVATGGSGTKTWSLSGSLPAGLSFSSSTGLITGTPTVAGTTTGLAITVTDGSGSATASGLSIVVAQITFAKPTLALVSIPTGTAVSLDGMFDASLAVGDNIQLQIATASSFASPVSDVTSAVTSTAGGAEVVLTTGNLPLNHYFARVRQSRGAVFSPWSNTLEFDITQAPAPSPPWYGSSRANSDADPFTYDQSILSQTQAGAIRVTCSTGHIRPNACYKVTGATPGSSHTVSATITRVAGASPVIIAVITDPLSPYGGTRIFDSGYGDSNPSGPIAFTAPASTYYILFAPDTNQDGVSIDVANVIIS